MRKDLSCNNISTIEKILDDAIHGENFAMECFEENKEKFKNWAFYPFAEIPSGCDSVIEEITRRYVKVLNADVACEYFKGSINK